MFKNLISRYKAPTPAPILRLIKWICGVSATLASAITLTLQNEHLLPITRSILTYGLNLCLLLSILAILWGKAQVEDKDDIA